MPRSAHAGWTPPARRGDPLAVLRQQDRTRIPELVPIRYGRMAVSPSTFLRGSAAVMARDIARTPTSGIRVQACGDCHLLDFGAYGTIIACAVLASAANLEESWGSGHFLVTVISAAVVLWIAGIYTDVLADRITDPFRVRLARAANNELAVLQSVVPVSVPLILWMLGVLSEDQAVYGSLIVGVGALATWGALGARQRGSHPVVVAGAAAFSALIGMIIIILKTWG